MEERVNAGFTIIKTIKLPDEEFVLGIKNNGNKTEYVTWCCVENNKYYYGHYVSNYKVAVIDLYERANEAIKWKLQHLQGGDNN